MLKAVVDTLPARQRDAVLGDREACLRGCRAMAGPCRPGDVRAQPFGMPTGHLPRCAPRVELADLVPAQRHGRRTHGRQIPARSSTLFIKVLSTGSTTRLPPKAIDPAEK